MDITVKDIELLDGLNRKIEERAKILLEKIHQVRPIDGYNFLTYDCCDGFTVDFEGDEYWAYGGHENYMYGFQTSFLYDERAFMEYIDKLHERNKEDEKEASVKEAKSFQKRKKEYEKLKKEFEVPKEAEDRFNEHDVKIEPLK